jgi:MFS family permease
MTQSQSGGRLWKHNDFMRFWFGQSVSQFGNQITNLALPTIAILVLHITVFEVGLLGAIEYLAFPVIGLLAGVWVDRHLRKRILVICNLGRLISLSSIPTSFFLNLLSIYQIFAVAGINSVLTVFFDVAYQSYLPSLVGSSDLVEGNSKLQTTSSAANVAGPTLAGVLIGLVGGAVAILADVFGYVTSVVALISIKKVEDNPQIDNQSKRSLRLEIKEGIDIILRNSVLARLTGCISTANFGSAISTSVYLFFAYNELRLSVFLVALIGSTSGLGALTGAILAGRLSARLGIGKTITLSMLGNFALAGYPLALILPAVPTLMVLAFVWSLGVIMFNINGLSMMQKITPNRLLGRMTATRRTFSWSVIPVASFLGGVLGGLFGLPATIILGGLIDGGAILWMVLGRIYKLNQEWSLNFNHTR